MKCKVKTTSCFSRINQIKLFISVKLICSLSGVYSKEILRLMTSKAEIANIYLFHFKQSYSCVRKCNLDTCIEIVVITSAFFSKEWFFKVLFYISEKILSAFNFSRYDATILKINHSENPVQLFKNISQQYFYLELINFFIELISMWFILIYFLKTIPVRIEIFFVLFCVY